MKFEYLKMSYFKLHLKIVKTDYYNYLDNWTRRIKMKSFHLLK